jgi:hypothetical protein
LERLLSYDGLQPLLKAPEAPVADPVLAMSFRKDNVSLELFTTIATLGTPQDGALFPMHERYCRNLSRLGGTVNSSGSARASSLLPPGELNHRAEQPSMRRAIWRWEN